MSLKAINSIPLSPQEYYRLLSQAKAFEILLSNWDTYASLLGPQERLDMLKAALKEKELNVD